MFSQMTLFCSVLGGNPDHGSHNLRVLGAGLEQLPRLVAGALVAAQLVHAHAHPVPERAVNEV